MPTRWHLVGVALALSSLVSCANSGEPVRMPHASSPSTSPYPRQYEWPTIEKRIVYKVSFDVCEDRGVDATARRFGTNSDPVAAARGFVRAGLERDFREAGFEGCYDGFVSIGEAASPSVETSD